MALSEEENLSSGIKFDNEGFLERCQITERENPRRFDGLNFGMGGRWLDACGFKTYKETSEALMKDVDDNYKRVGSTTSGSESEEWPCQCEEDFLPFGFESDLVHERKGLEKEVKDFWPNLGFKFVGIEEFGSKGHEAAKKKIGSKDVTVKNHKDPLPWRNIHIDHPLNDKITDDELLRMTNLAQGTLHSLSLVECTKITATCLRRILSSNPRLYEVCVVLKGETMVLNREGYFGDLTERCPGMRIDDSESETSYEESAAADDDDDDDDDDSASGKVYVPDDDPFGWDGVGSQISQMHCEDIAAAALPPNDFLGMGVSISDYPTDPFGVDWRKGEFVASVLDWVFN